MNAIIRKLTNLLNAVAKIVQSVESKPVEQLKLVHEELNRQRDANERRFSNMYIRASILIGASGVQSGLDVSKLHNYWRIVSVFMSFVAAGHGFWVMRPVKGKDAVIHSRIRDFLSVDPYSAEWQIVEDNSIALKADMGRLDAAAKVVKRGYLFLVFSWATSVVISIFWA